MTGLSLRLLVSTCLLLVIAGCPWPDSDPLNDSIPGFNPCQAGYQEDVQYDICPDDAGFPYSEWVSGVVEGEPAEAGEPEPVVLHADSGDTWNLLAIADSRVTIDGGVWFDRQEHNAPAVEVWVSAPCGSSDHWFAVRSVTTRVVFAAGGVAAEASWDEWTVDATVGGSSCAEPVTDCPCSDTCAVQPIRFSHPSATLDLYPSERSQFDGIYHAMTFERWTTEGASTCEDGRTKGQRWLVLGDGS